MLRNPGMSRVRIMKGTCNILFVYILLCNRDILDCENKNPSSSSKTLKNVILCNLNLIKRLRINRIETIKGCENTTGGDTKIPDLTLL